MNKLQLCLCCNSELKELLDWGNMPLANNYNNKDTYPLKLNVCPKCFHMQLSEAVDPDIMFKDYPYCSGTSKTALEFFDKFANKALAFYPDAKTVLDIACNDGTQLDSKKSKGLQTYGVDPAANLIPNCIKNGHNAVCGLFENTELPLKEFDIIVAQNVFAHTATPFEFLLGCKKIMNDDTHLFIQTSQAQMIQNGEFDNIYHEHISYFNARSMKTIVERAGLNLIDIQLNPIHGTSYIFVIKKHPRSIPYYVRWQMNQEEKQGLYNMQTYIDWVNKVNDKIELIKELMRKYRLDGFKIVGTSCPAKGVTLLNLCNHPIDLLIDTTPAKWYHETLNNKILPFEYLRTIKEYKLAFFILAWNFADEIIHNVKKIRNNPNDVFITTNDGKLK